MEQSGVAYARAEAISLRTDARHNRQVGNLRPPRDGLGRQSFDGEELGLGLGMTARDLAEPFARLARLQRHLLPADVDQLFEIDRAELGRIRQALFRRGARVQHLKLGVEARGKSKARRGTRIEDAVVGDRQ